MTARVTKNGFIKYFIDNKLVGTGFYHAKHIAALKLDGWNIVH